MISKSGTRRHGAVSRRTRPGASAPLSARIGMARTGRGGGQPAPPLPREAARGTHLQREDLVDFGARERHAPADAPARIEDQQAVEREEPLRPPPPPRKGAEP